MRNVAIALSIVVFPALAQAQQPAPPPAAPPAAAEEPAVKITPHGLLVLNFFYDVQPLAPEDVPLSAPGGAAKDGAVGATVRQSRFGLEVDALQAAQALGADKVSGTLEADFFGGYYDSNNVTYTMGHPRLRLFFVKMQFGDVDVVAGQDWAILAPLNPLSLTHVALPGFQGSGNLWARLPQVRVDANLGGLELAAGVLAPVGIGAVPPANGFNATRNAGAAPDQSRVPSLEGRIGYGTKIDKEKLGAGVSGHFGQEKVAGERYTSWAGALDVSIPVAGLLSVAGEAYYGQDIDGFFSAADLAQRPIPETPVAQRAYGGWGQLLVKPKPVILGAGAGFEKVTHNGQRRNVAFYGTVIYEFAPKLMAGLEYDHIRTRPNAASSDLIGNQISASLHFGF
jgi:hypothetical protein